MFYKMQNKFLVIRPLVNILLDISFEPVQPFKKFRELLSCLLKAFSLERVFDQKTFDD